MPSFHPQMGSYTRLSTHVLGGCHWVGAVTTNSNELDKEASCGPFPCPWPTSHTPLLLSPTVTSHIAHLHSVLP